MQGYLSRKHVRGGTLAIAEAVTAAHWPLQLLGVKAQSQCRGFIRGAQSCMSFLLCDCQILARSSNYPCVVCIRVMISAPGAVRWYDIDSDDALDILPSMPQVSRSPTVRNPCDLKHESVCVTSNQGLIEA